MSATCSDPLGLGCVRPVAPGINLKRTPHNAKGGTPCQKCRYEIARRYRVAQGRAPAVATYRRGKDRDAL